MVVMLAIETAARIGRLDALDSPEQSARERP